MCKVLILEFILFLFKGFARSSTCNNASFCKHYTESQSAFFISKMDFMFNWVIMHKLHNKWIYDTIFPFFSKNSLIRYLHPTDDELRSLAGVPKEKSGKGKDKMKNGHATEKSSSFHIPRNLDITLETTNITHFDVLHLRYFTEYQWLIDFSLYSIIVYTISEIYHYFIPIRDEVNLSMLWCLLVIFFAL